jgi:hypothetical protein
MTVARFVRAAIAVVLVTIGSGVPRTAVALLDDDCCVEQCDGEGGDESCPPDCASATCAKVIAPAIAPPATACLTVRADGGTALPGAARPVLPVVLGGVFHPPRR